MVSRFGDLRSIYVHPVGDPRPLNTIGQGSNSTKVVTKTTTAKGNFRPP